MPKNSVADDTFDWSQLLTSVGRHPDEMDFLKDLTSELQIIFNSIVELEKERLQLKARSQQITRDLESYKAYGRRVAGRIRAGIKAEYGSDNEQLTEFGMNPRRRRVRDVQAEKQALAKLSDPEPVS